MKRKSFLRITSIILASFIIFGILPFNIMGTSHKVFAQETVRVMIDGKYMTPKTYPIIKDDKIYVSVGFIQRNIHNDIELDAKNYRAYINIDRPKFALETNKLDERIKNGVKLNFVTTIFNNIHFVNIKGLEKLLGFTMEYDEMNNYISINKKEMVTTGEKKGTTTTRLSVYDAKSFMGSKKLEILGKDIDVEILEEDSMWAKVKTLKGNIGYVLKSGLSIYDEGEIIGEKLNEIREDYILDVKEEIKVGKNEAITTTRLSVYDTKSFIGSEKLEILGKDVSVEVIEEDSMWVKVKTAKENTGFVLKSGLVMDNTTIPSKNETINMSWNYVYKNSPDLSDDETIKGLDVLSPTWFNIANSNGEVLNRGDINYVKEAHKKGYKVWGMFSNSYSKEIMHNVLISEEKQEKVIKQVIVYSSLYDLDGINIDIENVYYEDKDKLTSFVKNLTDALKEQNVVVSMCMTVPSSAPTWSKFYDREKLGKILDYVMIMAYDEHWSASPVSGSVASIPWVKRGIENTLKYIPSEKIILGIPFYTRIWEETKLDNGSIKVSSKSISMNTTNDIIKEKQLTPVWLEDIGQYYVEYYEDGNRHRIWIENDKSIYLKTNLVHEYNLVGVASWRKGLEQESIWNIIDSVLK